MSRTHGILLLTIAAGAWIGCQAKNRVPAAMPSSLPTDQDRPFLTIASRCKPILDAPTVRHSRSRSRRPK